MEQNKIRAALLKQLLKDVDSNRVKGASVTEVKVIPKGHMFDSEPNGDEGDVYDSKDTDLQDKIKTILSGDSRDGDVEDSIDNVPERDIRDDGWSFGKESPDEEFDSLKKMLEEGQRNKKVR